METEFADFDDSEKILFECLDIAERKIPINERLGNKAKGKIYCDLGKNSLQKALYYSSEP